MAEEKTQETKALSANKHEKAHEQKALSANKHEKAHEQKALSANKHEKAHEQKALSTNKLVIAGFICLIAYAILFALSAANATIAPLTSFFPIFSVLSPLDSPMFFIMPFFAFFALFFMVDRIKHGLEIKLPFGWLCLAIFAVFFVLSLAAYYVALYWYISNFAQLQGVALTPDMVDFWGKLTNNAFLLFIWGGIFGIIARYAVEKIKI